MTASVGNDEPAVYSGGGSGSGGSSSDGSVPRVIVTGFDTNPAEVHAGSDFTLTIHLENTSKKQKSRICCLSWKLRRKVVMSRQVRRHFCQLPVRILFILMELKLTVPQIFLLH